MVYQVVVKGGRWRCNAFWLSLVLIRGSTVFVTLVARFHLNCKVGFEN